MPKPKMIKIKNGELEGECVPSALRSWERNGWTAVDDGSSESAPEDPQIDEHSGLNENPEE